MSWCFPTLADSQDPELEAALKKERDRLAARAPLTEDGKKAYSTPEAVKTKPLASYQLLVVRLSFSDSTCEAVGVEKRVFTRVADYYKGVSGGAFALKGKVDTGTLRMGMAREAFGKLALRSDGEREALGQALKAIDRTGFEGIAFIAPGKVGARNTTLWPHRWDVEGADFVLLPEDPGDLEIGIYAHEIGHLFGLEDQYDDPRADVGSWCLYGKGYGKKDPAPLCAGCREKLGWGPFSRVRPKAETRIRIAAGEIVKVPLNPDDKEYFLLEAREKTGLLAWHCGGGKSIELVGVYPSAACDRITPWSDPPFKGRSAGACEVWVTGIRFESGVAYATLGPSAPLTALEDLRKSRVGRRLGD